MLPDDVRRELRYIEMYTAKRIRNLRVGAYTSRVAGSGFDFKEHRPYHAGRRCAAHRLERDGAAACAVHPADRCGARAESDRRARPVAEHGVRHRAAIEEGRDALHRRVPGVFGACRSHQRRLRRVCRSRAGVLSAALAPRARVGRCSTRCGRSTSPRLAPRSPRWRECSRAG